MIPLRLQLKNFMSYGEGVPPLDLTGIRLACLSGDNGNGKTALLDAMTWALYGETRADSDDDVIRLGATDCHVLFDFLVGENRYRIHKARGKRGGAIWELQIAQEDGSTRSLSGTNARETKAKIEQLLRMDYRTFLASGYLAQGRADEFARSTVAERKKVLADILDLSRYERLEQLAKDKRKDAEDRETDAERELRAIEAELENEDRHHLELETVQGSRTEAVTAADLLRLHRETLALEVQRLAEREQKAQEFEARIVEIEEEITGNRRLLLEIQQRIAQADAVVARRAEIEAAYATFTNLTEQIRPLEAQYDSLLALQREAQAIENRIRDAHNLLDRERYQIECEVRALEEEAREEARYAAEAARIEQTLKEFGDLEQRRKAIEERRVVADDRFLELKTQIAAIRAEEAARKKRIDALTGSDGALCDYCGQPLPPDKRRGAIEEAEALGRDLAARQAEITALGRDAKAESDQARKDAETVQGEMRTVSSLEAQRAQAKQESLRIIVRTTTLPDVRRRLAAIEKRIADRAYAREEHERLTELTARMTLLEQAGTQLGEVRAQLGKLQTAERDRLQLTAAAQVLADEPRRADELAAGIAKREGQIATARRRIEEVRVETAALPERKRALNQAAADLQSADDRIRVADREIGRLTSLLARYQDLKRERVVRTAERQAAAKDKDLYKELIAAFGKKGVQALIIENALPEIETQANELLGKMTDGGMQLRLVTQREAKTRTASGSGGASSIETLDIIISDDMGTRPYEMYSGGEAFRINFALRVALSRLLAHRAGAPLQTLILDEGFGTQDPRGREAIVDAINEIADSFALILVITHIEELKDAFPTRIEVVKGAGGSTFTVS